MSQVTNPKPFIKSLIGQRVLVRLKFNNTSYEGLLVASDNYFNLSLNDVWEITEDAEGETKDRTKLGDGLFIRCNNVLYVKEAISQGEDEDVDDVKAE